MGGGAAKTALSPKFVPFPLSPSFGFRGLGGGGGVFDLAASALPAADADLPSSLSSDEEPHFVILSLLPPLPLQLLLASLFDGEVGYPTATFSLSLPAFFFSSAKWRSFALRIPSEAEL